MKAVNKFKSLLQRRRPYLMNSILGQEAHMVQPPLSIDKHVPAFMGSRARSADTHDRIPRETALVQEGVHRKLDPDNVGKSPPDEKDTALAQSLVKGESGSYDKPSSSEHSTPKRKGNAKPESHLAGSEALHTEHTSRKDSGKGHAHNPLEEYLFLDVGPFADDEPHDPPVVSESPPATEVNIYETAYHEEIERIRNEQGQQATLYLTRRVDDRKDYQQDKNMVGPDKGHMNAPSGFAKLLQKAKDQHNAKQQEAPEAVQQDESKNDLE